MTPASTGLREARQRSTAALVAGLLRLACASWRKRSHGLAAFDRRLEAGEQLIVVFWHGSYPGLLPLLRHRRALVFTSRSNRGDVIRLVLQRFGFVACQLPDDGGARSLATMRDAMARGLSAALAVDGPLGPYHTVHRGVIELAAATGCALVPASLAVSKGLTVKRRWDALTLPWPFARTQLILGEPVKIPELEEHADLSHWMERIESVLEGTDESASHKLGARIE